MPIPRYISSGSILKAVRHIDLHGYRARRESTKFDVLYGSKRYPPKLLISLAHRFVKGYSLSSNRFSGGKESNTFLQNLGFSVVAKKRFATKASGVMSGKSIAGNLVRAKVYGWNRLKTDRNLPPSQPGVYAWFFSSIPPGVPIAGCKTRSGRHLLYIGISPEKNVSMQRLRSRIRYHYQGNAEGSTLRLTLGCLLRKKLGIELRRVGSGKRMTFQKSGEKKLQRWMAKNAFVSWQVLNSPRKAERQLIKQLSPPLNIESNTTHRYYTTLRKLRAQCKKRARMKQVLKG